MSNLRDFVVQLLRNPLQSLKEGVQPEEFREPERNTQEEVIARKQKTGSLYTNYNGPGIRS